VLVLEERRGRGGGSRAGKKSVEVQMRNDGVVKEGMKKSMGEREVECERKSLSLRKERIDREIGKKMGGREVREEGTKLARRRADKTQTRRRKEEIDGRVAFSRDIHKNPRGGFRNTE